MSHSIRSLVSLVLLMAGACSADVSDSSSRAEALSADCIVRGDADAFDLDLALKYFKWNGETHSSVSVTRVADKIEDLRAKLATETDAATIDKLERRITNGLYLIRYQAMFLNSSGKISKNRVKDHVPSALAVCDDSGCEVGADEDVRFVHHAYRTFSFRDATSSELAAALSDLPDRSAPGYDPTDAYEDELAAWVQTTFTDGVCDAGVYTVIDPHSYYRKLSFLALGRDATDSLLSTVEIDGETIIVGGSDCEAQMATAYSRTFGSTEYQAPAADSYRYNLNPDATPHSCPTPL